MAGNIVGRSENAGPAWGSGINDNISFTLNTTDKHIVVCMSSDTSNAAVDEDMAGTLHVGGGLPIVSVPYAQETTRESAISTSTRGS